MSDDALDDDFECDRSDGSGPYCRHWSDPSNCEEICARCDHSCSAHDTEGSYCKLDDCECDQWEEGD